MSFPWFSGVFFVQATSQPVDPCGTSLQKASSSFDDGGVRMICSRHEWRSEGLIKASYGWQKKLYNIYITIRNKQPAIGYECYRLLQTLTWFNRMFGISKTSSSEYSLMLVLPRPWNKMTCLSQGWPLLGYGGFKSLTSKCLYNWILVCYRLCCKKGSSKQYRSFGTSVFKKCTKLGPQRRSIVNSSSRGTSSKLIVCRKSESASSGWLIGPFGIATSPYQLKIWRCGRKCTGKDSMQSLSNKSLACVRSAEATWTTYILVHSKS